ncbi:MAG: hypothetical protein A3E40_03780 [Candidatus Levybacteria bacterium RIFCSPHIGHO2_12_FULL_37_9]|nr:MAG: hypothetical protein A3E40_03780 [Candidatus Levybacteria bacterium RIFCSPHIGHO2_12_FULL_37_9]
MRFKISRFNAFLLIWLTIITLWLIISNGLISINIPKNMQDIFSKKVASNSEKKPQDIPELKTILESPDQATRLTAGRKLVERVDVEEALEILEKSSLPHTGEGHLVVHQIGFYAYQKYGVDSILKCKDYFLYACYHGAIIEAASDQGFEAITKMTDRCKASSVRYFQCVHAAGHAILAMWDYDLPKSLETCDQLYEKEEKFPEALSSCHNGAFMENLFGVHDWGTNKEQKRDWLSDDPYFPCNYFEEKYQRGCWLNQAARIYQMNNGDIVKTTQICEGAGNEQYTEWCMDNIARQIHPLTMGDPVKTFQLCQQVGEKWYNNCVIVNAGAFYSVGGREEAIFICSQVPPELKNECYQRIIGQIIADPIEKNTKEELCQKIEIPFKTQCESGLSSVN